MINVIKIGLGVIIFSNLVCCTNVNFTKEYDSSVWNYSSTLRNKTSYKIDWLSVTKDGYKRQIVSGFWITPLSKDFTSWGMNVPIRGKAKAAWKINDVEYNQNINLDVFNLRSYKAKSLIFEVTKLDRIDVSLGDCAALSPLITP